MKKEMRKGIIGIVLMVLLFGGSWAFKKFNFNPKYEVGQTLDSLNGVYVYYNGGVNNVTERNTTPDGYNLGLKYQCVEFVKRYYYQYYNHKMPDAYGHAKTFFDARLADSTFNDSRGLFQFSNPSQSRPAVSDLVVFSGSFFNKYGHVAIVSKVMPTSVEIIQQNPGPFGTSRETYYLKHVDGKWEIDNSRIKGWLRMPITETPAATTSAAPDTIVISNRHKLKSMLLDVDGDKRNDTATLVLNINNNKSGLKVALANGTIHYFGMGQDVLQQGFDELDWVGVFEVERKGSVVYNNVNDAGEIISEEEVANEDKITLPNDGIFIHAAEACGGGIIYFDKGRWYWVQQE